MVTEHRIDGVNASGNRAQWEIDALARKGFVDITLIDGFNKSQASQLTNCLVHAQQLSGRIVEGVPYIADAHGLEYVHSIYLAKGFPFHSWKKWAFKAKAHHYQKLENKIFKNSIHVICAGENIYERVSKIQNATVVRNAVFVDNYKATECKTLKIALVGPFLPGKINYFGLSMIKFIVKSLPEIDFVFIGPVDEYFKNELNFKNTTFTGVVKNYIDTLKTCSVLLAPYPEYAYYLGSKTKFIEAAACEMPIITTPSGVVDFQNDFVCIGKTKEELANQVLYLKDENIRKDLGKKLRKEIEEKYNADIEVEKIIKLYKEFAK